MTNRQIRMSLEQYLIAERDIPNKYKRVLKVIPKKSNPKLDTSELLDYLDYLFDAALKAKTTRQVECAYFALRGALLEMEIRRGNRE